MPIDERQLVTGQQIFGVPPPAEQTEIHNSAQMYSSLHNSDQVPAFNQPESVVAFDPCQPENGVYFGEMEITEERRGTGRFVQSTPLVEEENN